MSDNPLNVDILDS